MGLGSRFSLLQARGHITAEKPSDLYRATAATLSSLTVSPTRPSPAASMTPQATATRARVSPARRLRGVGKDLDKLEAVPFPLYLAHQASVSGDSQRLGRVVISGNQIGSGERPRAMGSGQRA